ncbi:hypothetical protein FACS1894208_01270 [Clostridia bacterium]|nr:hypothetical protein FACS1894208_01270 [Clostridia bacterium]
MLGRVKDALRVGGETFDGEIEAIIGACLADLGLGGVGRITPDDPLIVRAVVLYAKANFGYSDESEKYQRAYEFLKCSLSLGGDYAEMV